MGDAYRGLTIRIGADAQPLNRALSSIKSAARSTSTEVSKISRALKQDPGNTNLLGLKIRALGDQMKATATQAVRMKESLDQTLSKYKGGKGNLSVMLKEAEANAALFRSEFNRLDQTLQVGYDKLIAFKQGSEGLSNGDAVKAVKRLREEARHSAEAMRQLETQLRAAWTTAKQNGGSLPFGAKNVDEAIAKWKALVAAQKEAQRQLGFAKEFVGVKNLVVDLELAESELKQLSIEAINARNVLQQMGTTTGAKAAANQQRLLAESTKEAETNLKSMMGVSKALPNSFEAAVMQARSFEQATRLINQQIQVTSARLKTLDGSKVEEIERKYVTTGNAVMQLTEREARLNVELQETAAAIEKVEAEMKGMSAGSVEFQKAESTLKELNAQLDKTQVKLSGVRTRLGEANDAHSFREAESELAGLDAKLAAHEAMVARANKKWGQFGANLRTAGYSMMATIGASAMIGGMYAVQAATDIDAAYRNMRKTVNGTEQQFEHLKKAALEFSQTHFTSADQILEIEAVGGQLGIQVQNLERFAETVSSVDIATNLDTETISQNLGQLSNIMNDMDQNLQSGPGSMEAYGDALVRLGNNTAAQEDKIQNVMMRIASMGTICGMSTPDLLALASATAATGQGAEAAGTALSKTFSGIESAVNGSERALARLRDSGDLTEEEIEDLTDAIEAGQDKLQDFAEVAGMSAEDFKRAWNESPMEAFKAFIGGLQRIDAEGGSVDSTLTGLKITSVRQKQTLQGLTQTFDILGNAITMSNDAWNGVTDQWGAAGDAAREAQRKSEGFSGQLEMLKNNAKVLASTFLESLTPALSSTVESLRGLVDGFKGLPDEVKQTVVGATALAALSGPMMIATGTVLSTGSAMKDFFTGQKQGWTVTKTALESGGDALQVASTMLDKNGNALKKSGSLAERFGTMLFNAGGKVTDFGNKAGVADGPIAKLGGAMENAGLAAFGLAGKMLPIVGIAASVGVAAWAVWSAFDGMRQREEKLAKATETMADRISLSFGGVAKKSKSVFQGDVADALDYYSEFLETAAQRNEELGESADTLMGNLSKMQGFSSDILELLGELEDKGSLNENQFQMLSTAISEYNQITGESIQVTRNEDGSISVLKDNVALTADAFANLAKQKENAAKADYFQKEYNAAYEGSMDARIGKQKADAALKDAQERLKAQMSDTSPKTYEELTNWQNEIAATKATIESLTGEIQTYNSVLTDANLTMEQSAKMTELLNSKEAGIEGTIENLIASNADFTAAFSQSNGTLSKFKDICAIAGVSAERLADADLTEVFNGWDGSMQGLLNNLEMAGVLSGEAADSLRHLGMVTINDKNYFVDDDGSIQWQEGQLQDLQDIVIDGKHYYVTDDGTVYDQTGLCDGFNSFVIDEKHYIVTSDGTVMDEQGECEWLDSMVVNDKHYLVDNNGTVYDQQGQLQALQNFQLDGKTLYVTSDGLMTAEGELYTFNQLGIDPKDFLVDDNGTIRVAEDKIESLTKKINGVPDVKVKATIDDTQFNSVYANIKNKINGLNGGQVSLTMRLNEANATGGFRKLARQRNIALHAAGAFITNGTTYIGSDKAGVHHIAGEAGREFVQHHADGTTSIIPVQNRKYMAPFVAAVADMLPDYGGVTRDDLYRAVDAVIRASRQQGDIVLVLDDRELGRAVRRFA